MSHMPRRSSVSDPEALRTELISLLTEFEQHLKNGDLRQQVRELIPANRLLRDLGGSLLRDETATSARDRILRYLINYAKEIIESEELMVIGGISEYARRVRELRVEFGWKIITGYTVREMIHEDQDAFSDNPALLEMKPDDYMLISTIQDRDAAYRWRLANEIRKDNRLSMRDKILKFLRNNVGAEVSGEELRYVADNRSEWARRVRELRTEQGWPIATQNEGRPDLPIGVYVLEENKQAQAHDRRIKDTVRRAVLVRDKYSCRKCGWNKDKMDPADPRHLEVHHEVPHIEGGANTADNLVTLCNICHDDVHREAKKKKKTC